MHQARQQQFVCRANHRRVEAQDVRAALAVPRLVLAHTTVPLGLVPETPLADPPLGEHVP